MKGFRGTAVFAVIVCAVVGFAVLEFKKSQVEESEKATKDHIFKDLRVEDVKEISYKSDTDNYTLRKEGEKWQVILPVIDDGDESAVQAALRELLSKNIEALDTEGQALDPEKYGFSRPAGEFIFTLANGAAHKVSLGSVRTYDQGFYIRKDEDPVIYVSDSSWSELTRKKADDFRSKKIKFTEGELQRLKLISKWSKKPVQLEFVKKDAAWEVVKDPKVKLKPTAGPDLFNALKRLKADGILANAKTAADLQKQKLLQPTVSFILTLSGSDGKNADFKVDFSMPSEGEAAMIASSNSAIYRLPRTQVEDLVKNLDDLREKEPEKKPEAEAAKKEDKTSAVPQNIIPQEKKNE